MVLVVLSVSVEHLLGLLFKTNVEFTDKYPHVEVKPRHRNRVEKMEQYINPTTVRGVKQTLYGFCFGQKAPTNALLSINHICLPIFTARCFIRKNCFRILISHRVKNPRRDDDALRLTKGTIHVAPEICNGNDGSRTVRGRVNTAHRRNITLYVVQWQVTFPVN